MTDEYPSFKINKDDSTEHIYIASLLLLHVSRTTMFHTPMCNKLKRETQIRIKVFLENVLPLERDITRETMREVIVELEDISRTPNNRQTPLKEFANSSVSRSARSSYKIITERTREVRELKCNLEVERFKNADLRDDITIQQNKIQNLKKKLKEMSAQIKMFREERMKPNTPQPKKQDSLLCENYYKKYIDDMEIQLNKQQNEIDNLETEKDGLSKTLASVQRQSVQYKESFTNYERTMESLLNKIETKDRELIELRIHNEELRAHIKEVNKNSIAEQSFEIEDVMASPRPAAMSFNNSEALSSVIEIQLQEAKEESAILHAQVDSLKGKFDILTKDYRNALELNRDLQERVKILDRVQAELNDTQKELDASNINITNLQAEKISLAAQNENLQDLLSSREKELSKTEQSNTELSAKLSCLKVDMEKLSELLGNERIDASDLSAILAQIKSRVTEHLTHIHKLTDERDAYKFSIENCSKSLRDILYCDNPFIQVKPDNLDNLTLNDFINYFDKMLQNCNTTCASYKCDIDKLKATIDETNANLCNQQLTVAILKEQNQQNLIELANIEEERKHKDLLLNEQKETIQKYSQEIEALKEIRKEKDILEENVHRLTKDLTNQQLLLKSAIMYLKNLQGITKEFKVIKQEIQNKFIVYKDAVKVMFEKIYYHYQTLHQNLHAMKQEKQQLMCNFDRANEELSQAHSTNLMLEKSVAEEHSNCECLTALVAQNEDTIKWLRERIKSTDIELHEYEQNTKKLENINRALKEQYAAEVANKECLTSENKIISLELKDTTDKLGLLEQELNDTEKQIELKNARINKLLSDVSSLKTEKDHLIRSYEETIAAKNGEIELKREASSRLQIKIEKLMDETTASEKKMKEIIINLQEVRSSQDAVLATQETALKEKCLHIEQLQQQFDRSKEMLNKELEDEKSSCRALQIKFSELQERICDQTRDTEELREKLKVMHAELEASKDHCKYMDASQAEIVKLCQELEYPTKNLNSTIMETCSDFDILDKNTSDTLQYEYTHTDNKIENILNIIKMTLDELHISQKVILHLSFTNSELNKTLAEQKVLIENSTKDKEEASSLKNKVRELEIIAQKRNEYLNSLIKNKESLTNSLQKVFASRDNLDIVLTSSKQKWNEILIKFQDILHTESSVCDEFKQLQMKKATLENILFKYYIDHSENIKSISNILWEKFLWTEKKLHDTYLCSVHEKECLDVLTSGEEDQFSNEKTIIDVELEKTKALQTDIIKSEKEIQSFTTLATSYENGLKTGEIKTQSEIQKNLQNQINQLTKEKNDLKNKVDTMRSRNVKLEKNMDDLRIEMKKLKSETPSQAPPSASDSEEVHSLKDELKRLKEQNQQLCEEKDESNKIAKQGFESQLKEVHTMYERKLEDMKQKMVIYISPYVYMIIYIYII